MSPFSPRPGLPLRKDSVVSRALAEAAKRLNYDLREALKNYVELTAITFQFSFGDEQSPAAFRKAVMEYLTNLDQKRAFRLKEFEKKLAAFDKDVEDYEVWMTAARAASRFGP